VALGIVGLGAAAGAVAYFRKGGTVGGFLNKVKANQGAMTQFANALPISEAQKAKLTGAIADPSSVLPEQAQAAIHQVQGQAQAAIHQVQGQAEALKEQAHAVQAQVLQVLPPSVGAAVLAKEAALAEQAQGLAQQAHVQIQQKRDAVLAFAPVAVESVPSPEETSKPEAVAVAPSEVAHIAVSADQVEAIKAFLEQKAADAKN